MAKKLKPKAIWCDLDGTLANVDHRLHILDDPEMEYNAKIELFTSMCEADTANQWCVDILWAMRLIGHEILYITGRSDKFIEKTMMWLLDNVHFHDKYKPLLYMRPDGVHVSDAIVKQKIYELDIAPYYDVLFCLEDRPSVARMTRRIGLTCLQVDDREF